MTVATIEPADRSTFTTSRMVIFVDLDATSLMIAAFMSSLSPLARSSRSPGKVIAMVPRMSPVVGATVVGALVVGLAEVGALVVGLAEVGAFVVGAFVVGLAEGLADGLAVGFAAAGHDRRIW